MKYLVAVLIHLFSNSDFTNLKLNRIAILNLFNSDS